MIVSTVAGGIISLTVFSFSMVMIVLNQAASQMSNRILNSMIENRFQQIVLGFYIGTIVYALFLLSTIRNINSGIYIPAISIYLLILLTVVDIFLFIYFLDYVTQTVKFETVIERVRKQTLQVMEKHYCDTAENTYIFPEGRQIDVEVHTNVSGYYQGFDEKQLVAIAKEENIVISFMHHNGTYLTSNTCLLRVHGRERIGEDLKKKLLYAIDFFSGQPIDRNANYGFMHLAEVAIKALSPGINDPATAVLSINALTDLFAYRMHHCLPTILKDDTGKPRIITSIATFNELFEDCILPIWHYGRNDHYIQKAMLHMLQQLNKPDTKQTHAAVLNQLMLKVKAQIGSSYD